MVRRDAMEINECMKQPGFTNLDALFIGKRRQILSILGHLSPELEWAVLASRRSPMPSRIVVYDYFKKRLKMHNLHIKIVSPYVSRLTDIF